MNISFQRGCRWDEGRGWGEGGVSFFFNSPVFLDDDVVTLSQAQGVSSNRGALGIMSEKPSMSLQIIEAHVSKKSKRATRLNIVRSCRTRGRFRLRFGSRDDPLEVSSFCSSRCVKHLPWLYSR